MRKKKTFEEFVQLANIKHNNKYEYDEYSYNNWDKLKRIKIICPIHGEFWQTPYNHLQGCGCPYCAGKIQTTESNIERFKNIHGNKYDYSKVEYKNNSTKVCIICPEHGEFWQTPHNHLNGKGCPFCGFTQQLKKRTKTFEQFLKEANEIHNGKYQYIESTYKSAHKEMNIVCPKHGIFLQTPDKHINRQQGCPKCSSSKLETEIRILLQNENINFEEQKKFDWLGRKTLDFYLPEQNIAIECQGRQHYRPISFFNHSGGFEGIKDRDASKKIQCEENGVKLLYYTHENVDKDDLTFFSNQELIDYIITTNAIN